VTLARWSASRDFPSYGPLAEFYPRAASSGIDRFLQPPDTFLSSPPEENTTAREDGEIAPPPSPKSG
jgi:hypothetical protein